MPNRGKVKAVKHHAAMPYAEMPTFMTDLPTFAINATLMSDLPFDPIEDFKPITTL